MNDAPNNVVEEALAIGAFEQSPFGSLLLDLDGRIVAANQAVADLIGCTTDVLSGRAITQITAGCDVATTQAHIAALAGGSIVSVDFHKQCLRADGSELSVKVNAKLLRVGSRPPRILVSIVDLTQQNRMERELSDAVQRLALATSGAGIGIWDLDTTTWRITLDPRCQAMYGLDLAEGHTSFAHWLEQIDEEDAQRMQDEVARLLRPHAGDRFAMDFRTRDGRGPERRLCARGLIHRDPAGLPLRAVGANWDVSQDHAHQATMRLQVAAMNAASNSMFITDAQGRIVWINRAFEQITGYSPQEAVGQTPRLLKSGRQSDQWYQALWQTLKAGDVWRGHVVNRHKNGSLFDVEQTVTPIRDERGRIVNFVAVHEDVTERLLAEQRIRYLALYDGITALPNRSAFSDGLAAALARVRRSGAAMGVMLIDLDNFKNVNDSLGHDAGDALLVQVASRLRSLLRETDLPARLGGDEFGVLVESIACPEQAMETAQRLLEEIRRPYEVLGYTVHVSASIGITTFPGDADSPELLLKHADLAMYEAKSAGRDRVRYFDAAMDAAARRRFATEAALHHALSDDLLHLVYQPQFALDGNRLVGFEALLRWTDAERGPISPAEFVPLAEQSGLILQLNDWVLRHALIQVSAWKRSHCTMVPVAINICAAQFEQAGFDDRVAELLREQRLNGADIELEITEGLMLRDGERVRSNIHGLAELGVKLAIDDFGTGYSSLLSLRDYPVSRLKIDASFVRGIGVKGKDERIIRAVVSLASSLGLRVLAEGVETEAQARFLRGVGCEEVQGFLYARPLEAGAAGALLQQPLATDERLTPA